MSETLEFVFSFRSPFAWIAMRHVLPMVHPDTRIRWTPFLPLPTFPNFGALVPGKARTNLQDILRLAKAYGLPIGRPPVDEADWRPSHAAFLWADRLGHGSAFGRALFDERWVEGQRASSDEAIGRAAAAAGLEPAEAVAAANAATLQAELTELVQSNYTERDVFGVPMFILADGERFWGHDRMEWALRHGYVNAAP